MRGRARHARRVGAVLLVALSISCLTTANLAGADGEGVVKGAASSYAKTFTLEIGSGGAALGITLGHSSAEYLDVSAFSEGRALDLGLLEPVLGMPRCNGRYPPLLNAKTIPPKTIVDSYSTDSDKHRNTEVRMPGVDDQPAGDVVGTQDAMASEQPWAQANTTTVNTDILLLSVEGGRTESSAEFLRNTRIARAVSTADRIKIFGGLITFNKPRWEAVAKSGAEESEEATFSFESAMVGPFYRSPDQIMADADGFKLFVENFFGFLGLTFQMPEMRPAPGGGVEMSPMGFVMKDPPIGRDLLVPFLDSDLVKKMRDEQIIEDCRNQTTWTVMEYIEKALDGTGDIKLLVGGSKASTDPTDYSFKPESPPETVPSTTQSPSTTTTSIAADTQPPPYEEPPPSDSYYPDDLGTSYPVDEIDANALPEDTILEENADVAVTTKNKSREPEEIAAAVPKVPEPGDAGAIAVGVAALLGAIALSLGDRLTGRRSRRRIA